MLRVDVRGAQICTRSPRGIMNPLRRTLSVAAAVGAISLLAACSTTSAEPATGESSATRAVTTDQGVVDVPSEPQRIVVLNSNLAGYLFALDVPVLATIPESPGPGGADYPEAWADEATEDKTIVLPWGEDGFDFESILEQKPDLIVAGGQGFSAFHAAESYDRLTEIAPTVIVSKTLLTWQDQLSFIADDIFDDAAGEKVLVAAYDERVAEVSAAIALPDTPVDYLVMTADGVPYSLPENSALPQTLAELGFTPAPVIASNPDFEVYGTGDSFELSTEQVSQVFTSPSMFAFSFFGGEGATVESLATNPIYAGLPAFQNEQVYELPSWAYRADYIRTMDLLDFIEKQFS